MTFTPIYHESEPGVLTLNETDAPKCEHDPQEDTHEGHYRIFVFTENQRINLMQFDGTDGNGYYGTGFWLLVRPPSH